MAFVLVDSSVWVDFFRSGQTIESKKLSEYLQGDRVVLTTIIRCEILSGARNEKEFKTLKYNLSALPILEEYEDFWDQVAYVRFQLARRGIQGSLMDISIAVLAHHHNSLLLTRDKEFKPISLIIPIKLIHLN